MITCKKVINYDEQSQSHILDKITRRNRIKEKTVYSIHKRETS